eukprot:6183387-Pleurochrysis_carterae.AAC.1
MISADAPLRLWAPRLRKAANEAINLRMCRAASDLLRIGYAALKGEKVVIDQHKGVLKTAVFGADEGPPR